MKRWINLLAILIGFSMCMIMPGCDSDDDDSSGPPNVAGTWATEDSDMIINFVQSDYVLQGIRYDQLGPTAVTGRVFDGGGITFTSQYSFGQTTATGEVNGDRMDLTWSFGGKIYVFPLFRK